MIDLLHGDCLQRLLELPDCSVDACITDPPYGLSFMGKRWDYDVPSVEVWREVLRVLKPGGHLLAFAGTRTQHRMAVNIEDAGFEIRDMIAWVYGSGFPKSMNISKAFDRQAGVLKPESKAFTVAGYSHNPDKLLHTAPSRGYVPPAPVTPEAQQWQGWGTALKPALEPITVARKPFKGTVAQNVLEHGTGGINIDGCRVGTGGDKGVWPVTDRTASRGSMAGSMNAVETDQLQGRWPANLIHDGSDEVTELTGEAARFFYCAKASKADRGEGNNHPTVKPMALMRYLCRLVTPPGGVVLDPFMGSGSTGKAAVLEGCRFIGIEREAEYLEIARGRILVSEQRFLL